MYSNAQSYYVHNIIISVVYGTRAKDREIYRVLVHRNTKPVKSSMNQFNIILLLVPLTFFALNGEDLDASVNFANDIDLHLWIRWRVFLSLDSGSDADTSSWFYIGPQSAGVQTFSFSQDTSWDEQTTGSTESWFESGFDIASYGTDGTVLDVSTSILGTNTFVASDSVTNSRVYNGSTVPFNCSGIDNGGCCWIKVDCITDTSNIQDREPCNDFRSFESDRAGIIPTTEPTMIPTDLPSGTSFVLSVNVF